MLNADKARIISKLSYEKKDDKMRSEIEGGIYSQASHGERSLAYYKDVPYEIIKELEDAGYAVDAYEFHGYKWVSVSW